MKKFKRVVVISIMLCLLFTLSAGCGSAKNGTDTTTAEKVTSEASETAPVKPKQEKPFIFYTRTYLGNEAKPDNQKVLEELINKSGIKFEVVAVPQETYRDKLNLMFASGEVFDGFDVGVSGIHWGEWAAKGSIKPINDILKNAPNLMKYIEPGLKTVTDVAGKIYSIPRRERFPTGFVPTVREDWLKKFGMNMPQTIVELEAYMDACITKDPNGNGQKDEFALVPSWNFAGLTTNFTALFTGKHGMFYLSDDGKIMPIYAHPGYKTMVGKFAEWYKKGYIHPEYLVIKSAQINDLMLADRVGMTAGWYSAGIPNSVIMREKNPEVKYTPLANLKDAPGKPSWGSNPKYQAQICIPSTSTQAEYLINYLDWLASDPANALTAEKGLENVHWKWTDSSKKSYELIGNASEKYNNFYFILGMYFDGFYPSQSVVEGNTVQYEYSLHEALLSKMSFVEEDDFFVPYNYKGTPAEGVGNDAQTSISEAITRIIMGELSINDWDKALENYMKLGGSVLSEVRTQQYNSFTKK